MNDFRYKKYKKKLFEDKLSEPLKFCPYCRRIFNSTKYYEYTGNNEYKCLSCNKEGISHETYSSQQRNGQNYKINDKSGKNDKSEINAFILKEILKLSNEGFSQEQIYDITHFSRIRIADVINNKYKKKEVFHSEKTFFEQYLKINQELIKKISISKSLKEDRKNLLRRDEEKSLTKDEKKLLIKSTLIHGCSFDFIAKIFQVSKREISTCKKNLSDDELKELIRNKKQYQIQYVDNSSSRDYNISIKNLIVK